MLKYQAIFFIVLLIQAIIFHPTPGPTLGKQELINLALEDYSLELDKIDEFCQLIALIKCQRAFLKKQWNFNERFGCSLRSIKVNKNWLIKFSKQ